ncbi:restriction endonuclease [Acetobacterium sp.]|uniref:restriction endonuclease n=1 Tax=Acetobacterium sp. TaxID=1872094 RepID=UPI002F406B15
MTIIEIMTALLTPAIKVFWPFVLVYIVFQCIRFSYKAIKKNQQEAKLKSSGILDIDQFDGKTFETYLRVVFKERGYKVLQTSYTKDFGADLVIQKDKIKTVVQAKRYKSNVGIKAVQEVVASIKHYKCDKAIVVTNSHYTKAAIELAKSNDVELWNREILINELVKYNVKATITTDEKDFCKHCGKPLSSKVIDYYTHTKEKRNQPTLCYACQKSEK